MRCFRPLNLGRLILLTLTVVACATPQTTPSASVTTLEPGAARFFKLDWSAHPEAGETQRVDGYVVNTYGQAAQVQLLAQALDVSGQVIDQRIEYSLAPVPGFGRSYFNIRHLAAADHYQVTVWSAYFYQGRRIP